MDIFEYNEVRWPTRALQQEEEEQAAPGADQALLPPDIKWTGPAADHEKPRLLVVAMSPASCALLLAAMGPSPQEVGQVVPQAAGDKPDAAAGLYAPLPGVLVCCCGTAVAPERAGAWARGVLKALQPQRMLLLGAMQAEQYRGEADASQELLAFVLRSTPLREQLEQQQQSQAQPAAAAGPRVPYLPSGSIVSGLQAALLTQAELTGVPAELLVVVEQVPSLVPETLGRLGQLLVGSLRHALAPGGQPGSGSAGDEAWAAALVEGGVVDTARLKLQRTAYRPSSVYS